MLQMLNPVPQLTQVLLPISFSKRTSSLRVMFRTPWIGKCLRYSSSCPLVLGKPSKITPFADSGYLTFWLIILTTISSLTNPPDFTILLIVWIKLLSNPLDTVPLRIFLISSPVETWLKCKSFVKSLAYVPFPTPGAPKRKKNFCLFELNKYEVCCNLCILSRFLTKF